MPLGASVFWSAMQKTCPFTNVVYEKLGTLWLFNHTGRAVPWVAYSRAGVLHSIFGVVAFVCDGLGWGLAVFYAPWA